MNREKLKLLHQTEEFQSLLKEVKALRPIVPAYDHVSNNVELMKFKSTQQQMYDMVMSIIDLT